MIVLRPGAERGHFDFGWLNTFHTFSFADYWDPKWMGFHFLRVINEDRVAPAEGFGTHPHRDMEIITYVISGSLQHRDSMGNGSVLTAGEVQRMSAGSGITHSEFNGSKTEPCHLLQIWLLPAAKGFTPSYEEKVFPREAKLGRLCPVATPDRRGGSLAIHQDAMIYASVLPEGAYLEYEIVGSRALWVQVVSGQLEIEGEILKAGDGAGITDLDEIAFTAIEETEFLLFDMKV